MHCIPLIIKKCMKTWEKNNPNYIITILDDKKFLKLCNIDITKFNIKSDFHERKSDFIRLFIIYKYGGIWMDTSIICNESLDWIYEIKNKTNAEFIGYYSPHTTVKTLPIPENWFFAAIPKSIFIKDWIKECCFMLTFSNENDYVKFIKNNINMQGLTDYLPYLIMHLCVIVILNKNFNKYNLHLLNSSDGPFKYLQNSEWKSPQCFENLCSNKDFQTKLIKLRGFERKFLQENLKSIICDKNNVSEHIYNVLENNII